MAWFAGVWFTLGFGATGLTKLVVRRATPKAVRTTRRKRFDYNGLLGIGDRAAILDAQTAGDYEPASGF